MASSAAARSRKLRAVNVADTEHLRETLVRSRAVYDGHLLHVREDEVRCPSGAQARREVVDHPGAVTMVAVTTDRQVVLVRQWRHAAGRALWELPAGTREPNEDPLTGAQRELSEETGYSAGQWRELGRGLACPGYSNEAMVFYIATELTDGTPHPDDNELLDVTAFDESELRRLIAAGEVDIKTIAGLALAGFSVVE